MDSIFPHPRHRGELRRRDHRGAQLLSEIDGVGALENVIVIGASNREGHDRPAILRPGRLDVKIKIERPMPKRAPGHLQQVPDRELRSTPTTWPSSAATAAPCIKAMIEKVVDRMYAEIDDNRFLRSPTPTVTRRVMYFGTSTPGDDPERRGPGQEVRDQVGAGVRPEGSAHPAPAGLHRRRVRRERGPAQHHQPDDWARIRAEGRADRRTSAPWSPAEQQCQPGDRHRVEPGAKPQLAVQRQVLVRSSRSTCATLDVVSTVKVL